MIDSSPQNGTDGEHVALQKCDGEQRGDGVEGDWTTDVDQAEDE